MMKKITTIFILILCLMCTFAFFLINKQANYELSLTNAETKIQISLGEYKKDIEDKLGNPYEVTDYFGGKKCSYSNDDLYVVYDSNDIAVTIVCISDEYTFQKDICVGDDIEKVKGVFKSDFDKFNLKSGYLYGDVQKCVVISQDNAKNRIAQTNSYDDVYIIDFGASISDKTVENIILSTYQASMGIIK